MRPVDHLSFVPPGVGGAVVDAWRAFLRGDLGPRAALDAVPGWDELPGPWRDGFSRSFDLLDGWRDLTRGRPDAEDRVLEAVAAALARVSQAVRAAPEHPRAQPEVLALEAALAGDAVAFGEAAPRLFAALAEAMPGAAAWAEPLAPLWDDDATDPGDATLHARVRQRVVADRWAPWIGARADAFERGRLFDALAGVAADLRRKQEAMEALSRVLGTTLDYVSLVGEGGAGVWSPHVWEAMERWADLARQNPHVARIAALLGRYEADRGRVDLEEELRTDTRRAARALRGGRSEVRGLRLSDDLDRLCASDLGLLAEPELELLFYVKYAEKRLSTYEMEGQDSLAWQRETRRLTPRSRARERGPVLLALDTSASMAGEPELVAKTLCLAVLRAALRERRPCWLVAWSGPGELREVELSRLPQALPELVRFLTMSFRGGTDPEPAMRACLARLEEGAWARADLLWVTDGVFTVPVRLLDALDRVRAVRPVRTHALVVGPGEIPPFADVGWRWTEGASFARGAVQLVKGTTAA